MRLTFLLGLIMLLLCGALVSGRPQGCGPPPGGRPSGPPPSGPPPSGRPPGCPPPPSTTASSG